MSDRHEPQSARITTTPSTAHGQEAAPPHGTAAEEAHHAEHSSHDPFARRVAITMVVIAAVLAGVKVLGHRAHNDTLHHNIKAGQLHTEADTLHTRAGHEKTEASNASTKASNEYAYYQAKKLRQHFYETQSELLAAIDKDGSKAADRIKDWKANALRYKQESEPIRQKAEGYLKDEQQHLDHAKDLEHEAEKVKQEAEEKAHESENAHYRSNYYDLGEMGVELALVLCSVAILTKWSSFWYGGIVLGVAGALVAVGGLLLH
jgi:hypothetical protein